MKKPMGMKIDRKMVKLSDLKFRNDVFISKRKVSRFAAEMNGEMGGEETPGERAENIMFLSRLLVNLTLTQRMAVVSLLDQGQQMDIRSVLGVNEVVHYVAENLRYRIAASTPNVWLIDDCLEDYVEVATHYSVNPVLERALTMTAAEFEFERAQKAVQP